MSGAAKPLTSNCIPDSESDDRHAGGGAFTAEKLNLHSRTNMEIIRCFLPVDFVTTQEDHLARVEVKTLQT
jgi:hypothetical protein